MMWGSLWWQEIQYEQGYIKRKCTTWFGLLETAVELNLSISDETVQLWHRGPTYNDGKFSELSMKEGWTLTDWTGLKSPVKELWDVMVATFCSWVVLVLLSQSFPIVNLRSKDCTLATPKSASTRKECLLMVTGAVMSWSTGNYHIPENLAGNLI